MNTQIYRRQMIEMIQKRIDEFGFDRYMLSPYFYEDNTYNIDDSDCLAKSSAINKYIYDNLGDYDYRCDEDMMNCFGMITQTAIDEDYRYSSSNEHVVHLHQDTDSDVVIKLIEISNGNCIGVIESNVNIRFEIPLYDLCNVRWNKIDEELEHIWEWINDLRMIKFNELVNKSNEYFENEVNK